MNCPFCGFKNKNEEARYCEFCGKSLLDESKPIIRTVYEKQKVEKPINNYHHEEVSNDIKEEISDRNILGFVDTKLQFFHYIIYACAAYLAMYGFTYAIVFILAAYYRNQGVDFSQTSDAITLLTTKISALSQAAGELAVVAVTMIVFRKHLKKFFAEFKQANTYKWFAIGFAILYGGTLVYSLILSAFKITSDTNANQQAVQDMVFSSPLLGILFVSIAAPLFEELVFRFGIFRSFTCGKDKEKAQKTLVVGIVVTSLIFAFIHMVATFEEMAADPANALALLKNDLIALPEYLIGAFGLTYTYYKSKNLASSMMVHIAWNTMSLIAMFASQLMG